MVYYINKFKCLKSYKKLLPEFKGVIGAAEYKKGIDKCPDAKMAQCDPDDESTNEELAKKMKEGPGAGGAPGEMPPDCQNKQRLYNYS